MRKSILSLTFCVMTLITAFAVPPPNRPQIGEKYIEQYRQIAVMESLRTGIPASIKLAQGILESGYGTGSLAVRSNNHFGLKWRSPVDGDYVEFYDDEKKNGKKIYSKFIKFNTPEESYQQHSELLLTRPVYRILFTYDRSDYRKWAYGLEKAGYASARGYAEKLIRIIEQYDLGRFDVPTTLDPNDFEETPNRFTDLQRSTQSAPVTTGRVAETPRPIQPTPVKTAPIKYQNSAPAPTQNVVVEKPVYKQEEQEEHILYEVTPNYATKSIKKPVPKRQKK